jgi:hypothetical protein
MAKTRNIFILQNSKDTLLKQVYKQNIAPYEDSLPRTVLQGLEMVCAKDKYVTMSSETVVLSNWKQLPCTVQRVPNDYMAGAVSMAIRKYSPFREILKLRYVKLFILFKQLTRC